MTRPSTFVPARTGLRKKPTSRGITDFLQSHDKMAALLPSITRMMTLQADCAGALPAMFDACGVLQFESGQLVLSTPNAALASRLRQQLPKLQDALHQRGWQVNAIRLKVQVGRPRDTPPPVKQLRLPDPAVSALTQLETVLENTPRNATLLAAIHALANRPRA
ncbi:hypothetical protein IMCC9480_3541 [Oxalobacteraceae bacterium IMCC9480]|nr:hypothetical protein IMCC9480_3541 [Oxalobacteraceae bacterium IMCC9480]NDP57918.1 DUF721 domain-containing protein [Oxalobacteraceae bacterium]